MDQHQVDTLWKVSDQDWIRSFIEEIRDYEKLEKIGQGETEIKGFKVRVEKVEGGVGKSYYQFKLLETIMVIRVYEDGTIAVKNEGRFWRLNPETLKIENPIDEPTTEVITWDPDFHSNVTLPHIVLEGFHLIPL